jgi:hypothetical protein
MKCSMLVVWFLFVASALSPAQMPPTQGNVGEQQNRIAGVLPVRLSKNLDSAKAKAGDAVAVRTVTFIRFSDGTGIPSDTRVVGHLTEATAKSKGDIDSTLGVVFDSLVLSNGKELKIRGTLQAIAPAPEVSTGAGPAGTIPIHGNGSPGAVAPPEAWQDLKVNSNSIPTLNDKSKGVLGFPDLEMGVDSLLTSGARRIKLNSGTQMMIEVQLQPPQ